MFLQCTWHWPLLQCSMHGLPFLEMTSIGRVVLPSSWPICIVWWAKVFLIHIDFVLILMDLSWLIVDFIMPDDLCVSIDWLLIWYSFPFIPLLSPLITGDTNMLLDPHSQFRHYFLLPGARCIHLLQTTLHPRSTRGSCSADSDTAHSISYPA